MKTTLRRLLGLLAMTAGLCTATAQAENLAICYNCPPQWADWAGQVANIKEDTGITVPLDNKNSGQSLAQIITEKASPVADVVYLGISAAIEAMKYDRSEERRVGKECVSTCRSRWSPNHSKKKNKKELS